MSTENENSSPETLELPAPTAWPFVMAVGLTLIAAGVVTNLALTFIGLVIFFIAGANWAWLVFAPGVGIERVPLVTAERRPRPVQPAAETVETLGEEMPGSRLRYPEKMHPYSAGAKGGLIGGIAMTIPALIFGIASRHGVFYPLNLLAGMVIELPRLPDGSGTLDIPALEKFHWSWLIIGLMIHGIASVSLGLIYGVLLPMLPSRRPYLWGGLIAPLLWTGGMYGFMGVLNPVLNERVDWISFAAAQFVYGLTVGIVVVRTEKVYVTQ